MLLIMTSGMSKNVEEQYVKNLLPSTCLKSEHLSEKSIDWLGYFDSNIPPKHVPWTPRPHQEKALTNILTKFETHERGQAIMACGTGKTLVALWVSEALGSKSTLVLVPSLALINQVSNEWIDNSKEGFRTLFVCSDKTVIDHDKFVVNPDELGVPIAKTSEDIEEFMSIESPKVIFSTYQSSHKIVEAQENGNHHFDLVVADEAHHCTGKIESHFANVLDGKKIKSKKRLFMTATPRAVSQGLKSIASKNNILFASMDDESQFGPEFHRLPFGEAIADGILTDYQIAIVGVSEDLTKTMITKRSFVHA